MSDLDLLQAEDEILIPFNELEVGHMYPINAMFKETRKFDAKTVESLKVDVSTCQLLRKLTYLPSSCLKANNSLFDQINEAGKTDKKYGICYYGTIGKKYIGRIHKPDDGPSEALIEEVSKCAGTCSLKRTGSSDDSASPAKKIIKIE